MTSSRSQTVGRWLHLRRLALVGLLFASLLVLDKALPILEYEHQFDPSPHGFGGENAVFFVDAKLAFGWAGFLPNCMIFVLCAAAIFASDNDLVKLASLISFLTVSVGFLSATLLSGGLSFCLLLALRLPGAVRRMPRAGR